MSINLVKGQKIDLTKSNPELNRIMLGLGWDEVSQKTGGFLSSLLSTNYDIDCDASAIMLDENSKLANSKNVIYFGNLTSVCKSVKHLGDNLTGAGDGDDEQIIVDLKNVPSSTDKIVLVVNIYDCIKRKQDFGMIRNAFIRIVDMNTNKELMKYNLTEDYKGKTAMVFGELYRHNGEWKFNAIGEGTSDYSIRDLCNRYI